jgi:hypothetical protein
MLCVNVNDCLSKVCLREEHKEEEEERESKTVGMSREVKRLTFLKKKIAVNIAVHLYHEREVLLV